MSRKSVLSALFLIFLGIVFGVILVSNFKSGVEFGFAGDPFITLGSQHKVQTSFDPKVTGKAFVEVAKAVTPTVVSITVTTKGKGKSDDLKDFFHYFGPDFKFPEPEQQQGAGSGVIIHASGYILTNNHVVADADENSVEVVLDDSKRMKAKIIGTDPSTDLAVIKVDGSDLPTAALGNSDELKVGEWVIAIGNPLGLQSTVTAGIVSAIGRNIGIIQSEKGYGIENFIQTDAAINPGNSGGPLVNLSGEVVGINSAIATTNGRYQGYGFSVPINLARNVADDIIKYGKVRRGYIGVTIRDVDGTTAKALGLDKAHGVLVNEVVKGGAAEQAGIKAGDVIFSIDGKEVNKANELQSMVARHHPGDDVKLKMYRDGKPLEKTVTLRSRTDEKLTAKNTEEPSNDNDAENQSQGKSLSLDNLGLTVAPLTSDQKKDNEVENGIAVTNVKQFREAFERGLRQGDIILEVDKKDISSPKEFRQIIDKHKAEDAVLLRVKKPENQTIFVAIQIPKPGR